MLNPTVTFLLFLGCGGRKGRGHQKLNIIFQDIKENLNLKAVI